MYRAGYYMRGSNGQGVNQKSQGSGRTEKKSRATGWKAMKIRRGEHGPARRSRDISERDRLTGADDCVISRGSRTSVIDLSMFVGAET